MVVNVKVLSPLVFYNELQVAVLSNRKSKFIALAVPSDGDDRFIVTSVTPDNLKQYLSEVVDLRFLFTYPHKRSTFYCTITGLADRVQLARFDEQVPEDHLPERGFFSRFHTHEFVEEQVPTGSEILKLDGQWELFDFARFQAKFSDIYSFLAALKNVIDQAVSEGTRAGIRQAFLEKPFRGGGSYGSLFSDLSSFVPPQERLSLRKIKKASPGEMELRGEEQLFDETEDHVKNYLEHRAEIEPAYKSLHGLLQTNGLLRQDVARYDSRTLFAVQMLQSSLALATLHKMPNVNAIHNLCGQNSLATTKVVLAFHRRVEGAAEFFAQGRVAFA